MQFSRNVFALLFSMVIVIFIIWPLIGSLISLVAFVAISVILFAVLSVILVIPVASLKMLWTIIFKDGF